VGSREGENVGCDVGDTVGICVVGDWLGDIVGLCVGFDVG